MKTKYYIAGKITGDPNYEEKFKEYENKIKDASVGVVLSPAILPKGMTTADYMRICFAMIDCADMVVFLPDYKDSDGAQLEKQYCEYTKKTIIIWEDFQKWVSALLS